MFHQYHSSQGILSKPPIQFGNRTSYTRTQSHFANLNCCQLSQIQKFFRSAATAYNFLTHDQTCLMKILSILYDSEVFANVVSTVGKMDPRLAVHTVYAEELKSPLKA